MELVLVDKKNEEVIVSEFTHWIDVRLDIPPRGKTVMIYGCNPATTSQYFVTMGALISIDDRNEQYWLMVAPKNDVVYMVKARVSHWMEMPKPPKSSKPW